MGLSLILPMTNRAVLRARFFQWHGVTSHARCSSGVREEDGVVVFAPMERQELLALRVLKVGREYWAKWGHAVRAEPVLATVRNDRARA